MADNDRSADYESLVSFMVEGLLDKDDKFEVRSSVRPSQIQLDLLVPEHNRGRVIGKGGRIARAMRTILDTAAIPDHRRTSLDIVD
jgi:predicted RNA-binding protein YlqC (UPF0109 family)